MLRQRFIFAFLLAFFIMLNFCSIKSQNCQVTANASPTSICSGETVNLSATGGCGNILIETFNADSLGAKWDSKSGGVLQELCGPGPDSTYIWFQGGISRHVTTKDLDLSSGGATIKWWMRYGRTIGSSDCNYPNPNEGVHLQYSTDGGTSWTDFPGTDQKPTGSTTSGPPFNTINPGSGGYWDPTSQQTNELYFWNKYENTIPSSALTVNTRLRWTQPTNSAFGYDTWGLDNVKILSTGGSSSYTVSWSHGPTTLNPSDITLINTGNKPLDTCFAVTVSDSIDSSTDTVCITVYPAPSADFSISDSNLCAGDSLTLNYTGNAPASASYSWNIEGTTLNGQGPHSIQFAQSGAKNISLTVSDSCISPQNTKTVEVHPLPSISFTPGTMQGCTGAPISFSNQTTPSSCSWNWNFGDGNSSTQQSPSHVYNARGTYKISLEAISPFGCKDSMTDIPLQVNASPKANIDYQWEESDEIIFSDASTAGAASYALTGRQWSFGPAASPQTSQDSSVHVIYSSPGNYETELIVQNDHSCSDTSTLIANITSNGNPETETGIKIYPNPSPGIVKIEIPDSIDYNLNISVYDLSGKLIRDLQATDEKNRSIDLSDEKSGNYLFVIENKNFIVTRKIMIE
ncbi:MAG: PKD domain-containing protein [Bacteroidales bacterium]|nr:PKD domain-containing protein [Bacteroidales bacterium]MCF8327614.1 PKD domain-containing protein [Bacteroidales bacterium]